MKAREMLVMMVCNWLQIFEVVLNKTYLPTRERITVKRGAAGNAMVTFKSNI